MNKCENRIESVYEDLDPKYELHLGRNILFPSKRKGHAWRSLIFNNDYYRVAVRVIVDDNDPDVFSNPMRTEIGFEAHEKTTAPGIVAFIIPDKADPEHPELGMICSSLFRNDERWGFRWALVDSVPAKAYHAARTLIAADRYIRETFPGYCLIIKRPTLEAPQE